MTKESFSENLAAGMEERWDYSDESIATNVVLENISIDTSPETFVPLEDGETIQSVLASMVSSLMTESGLRSYISESLEMAAIDNALDEWGIGSGYKDVDSFTADLNYDSIISVIREVWESS